MRTTAVVLLTLLTLALLPGVAHAESKVLRDGPTAGTPPEADILWVRIADRPRTIRLELTFRDLRAGRRAQTRVAILPSRGRSDFLATALRRANGSERNRLMVATDQEFGGSPIPCRGFRTTWQPGQDRVVMVVPHRCLAPRAQRHRFKAIAGFWTFTGPGDSTRFIGLDRG
ncbi:hypothetical protein [Nocardioides insulae]|uniref:hypothetical protein n=1 Tax=Nocardioides insulae TaxID=394734 RepID=UPI000400F481|nr:hypothetical protein [Nocardioides insulae]